MHRTLMDGYWGARADADHSVMPFERICTLAWKMGCRWVHVEDGFRQEQVRQTLGVLAERLGPLGGVSVVTMTFLRRRPDVVALGSDRVLIGQVTMMTYLDGAHAFVVEALLRQPGAAGLAGVPLLNNFVPAVQTYDRSVMGMPFRIPAAYFCQNDPGDPQGTRAALRTVLRCLNGDRRLPQDTWSPGDASPMTTGSLARSLGDAGYNVVAYLSRSAPNARSRGPLMQKAWTTACASVESGNPVLLIFADEGGAERALPVVGYTVNTDEWHPTSSGGTSSARPSSSWIDHLVVQDPLQGPYLCLSRAWLAGSGSGTPLSLRSVILPLPAGVRSSPAIAERVVGMMLQSWMPALRQHGGGRGRWWDLLSSGRASSVLRVTLVGRDDYGFHLAELFREARSTVGSDHLTQVIGRAPDTFWLCEVSLPELHAGAGMKLGEFLVRADRQDDGDGPGAADALDDVVALRLPSIIGWPDGKGNLRVTRSGVDGPTPSLIGRWHSNRW